MKYSPKEVPPDSINVSDESRSAFLLRALSILSCILVALYLVSYLFPPVLASMTPRSVETKLGEFLFKTQFKKTVVALDEDTKALWQSLHKTLPEHLKNKGVYKLSSKNENAFAVPGGKIFLTNAFIKNAESDNEKLFVMAHELGHQHYRHPLRSLYSGILSSGLGAVILGTDSFSNLMLSATSMSFSRAQEKEADMYALDLVQKVSGNTKGAFNFFKRMNKKYGFLEKLSVGGGVFSTHPISEKRVEYLEAECKLRYAVESCS